MKTIASILLLALLCIGCGGERDKGRNLGKDRPGPAKEKPEKK